MIKFVCILCGERISVQDQYAGKRITCPKCSRTCVVPAESPKIKFACQNCGQGIRVLQIHAGKEAKCPKCKNPIVVPSLRADPETGSETVDVVCSMCGEVIKVPKGSKDRYIECPSCSSNVESSVGGEVVDSDKTPPPADEDDYDDESDEYEQDEGLDRRVILVVSAAALVIVAGLIILVFAILPSDSSPADKPGGSMPRKESAVADSSPQPAVADERPEGSFTLEPPVQEVAPAEPAASPTDVSNEAPGFDLKLRLSEGRKRKLRITSEDRVAMKLTGQSQDIHSVSTTDLELAVEHIDANGVGSIRVTFLALKEKGESVAGTMEYDSTNPAVGADNPLAPTYSSMIGKSLVMRVTPDGKMVGLSGIDDMYLQMARTIIENEDESIRQRMKERHGELSEERALRIVHEITSRFHGDSSVGMAV